MLAQYLHDEFERMSYALGYASCKLPLDSDERGILDALSQRYGVASRTVEHLQDLLILEQIMQMINNGGK